MKKWYVLKTKSGAEKKAKENLEKIIDTKGFKPKLGQVIVPIVKVPQMRKDKKVIVEKKVMPGYIIAELDLDEELKLLIKKVPLISGFLGDNNPKSLSKEEVRNLMSLQGTQEEETSTPPPVFFAKGEKVKIIDGPYSNFSGIIEEVLKEEGKLKIKIEIFGQSTTIDVDYHQVIASI
ncbi:MAG: transcription termination/antitermination protein NusG [Leptonema sp. (in: bacteria)]